MYIITKKWIELQELCDNGKKWFHFVRVMFRCGYKVSVREAKTTFSKYILVMNGDYWYRVRFSDHPPIRNQRLDCDLYCCPGGTATTEVAIITTIAVLEGYYGSREDYLAGR